MQLKGLSNNLIEAISNIKNENQVLRDFRLDSFNCYLNKDMPDFGPQLDIDLDSIIYYKKDLNNSLEDRWQDIDKDVFDELSNLGVIDAEKDMDGMKVQYESEVIYHNMIEELKTKNVLFTSIEEGYNKYPDIFFKYFSTIVENDDNKFAALNSCVFSGGSFIYIPPNTKLDRPLQSYFRMSSRFMGQFERTLIIVDDNSELHYIEGCTAPNYTEDSLHAAVVEIYVGKNSKCRYTTIQNWPHNVYNLVTKRALVEENGLMEWIDGNLGSNVTMKYPACILKGDNSEGVCISVSVATNNQKQDTGAKMIHIGKNTKSKVIAKSISSCGGDATYRGLVSILDSAINSESIVKCDTLILDDLSKSDTIANNICKNNSSNIEHEATVARINEEKLFYLTSRGIDKERATELIILGFLEKFKEELPMEYAVELNQLLKRSL